MPVLDFALLECGSGAEQIAFCAAFNTSFAVTLTAGLYLAPIAMVFSFFGRLGR